MARGHFHTNQGTSRNDHAHCHRGKGMIAFMSAGRFVAKSNDHANGIEEEIPHRARHSETLIEAAFAQVVEQQNVHEVCEHVDYLRSVGRVQMCGHIQACLVCMHMCVRMRMNVCVRFVTDFKYTHVETHHQCVHTHMCLQTRTYAYTRAHVYTHKRACTHTNTHSGH